MLLLYALLLLIPVGDGNAIVYFFVSLGIGAPPGSCRSKRRRSKSKTYMLSELQQNQDVAALAAPRLDRRRSRPDGGLLLHRRFLRTGARKPAAMPP